MEASKAQKTEARLANRLFEAQTSFTPSIQVLSLRLSFDVEQWAPSLIAAEGVRLDDRFWLAPIPLEQFLQC